MTMVYVVMVNDRHCDPDPHVFATPEAALEFARSAARDLATDPVDVAEQSIPGWLYYASCSPESESVWVMECAVKS